MSLVHTNVRRDFGKRLDQISVKHECNVVRWIGAKDVLNQVDEAT